MMAKEELKQVWQRFIANQDFTLNPDTNHVDMVAEGVLLNEKKFGLKLCPCRLRDGTRKRDLELICPCNFKIQDAWKNQNRCWCGLFIKE
jgi:ferredoxin-thioredoxin reductase catalytic subunit